MSKIDKALETIGEWVVGGIALCIVGIVFVFLFLLAHPVGWAILIRGVCKMFGVI